MPTTYPDEAKIGHKLRKIIVDMAKGDGILRVELERICGQQSYRWFRFMQELAAEHDLRCKRVCHIGGRYTRFDFHAL
ncbi:MAG: hypothetical protein ACJ8AI_04760 [Rhodopila sp.]